MEKPYLYDIEHHIESLYSYTCVRCNEETVEEYSRAELVHTLQSHGWKRKKYGGVICPCCIKLEDEDEN